MSKKYILNLAGCSRELHAYLKVYYLGPDHPIDDKVLLRSMEELLVDLVQLVITESRHSKMPSYWVPDEVDAYEKYGKKTRIDPNKVKTILNDTILLDNLLTKVHDIVHENKWGIYEIKGDVLEYLGDFRILEWERDHLDQDGNYVN